MRLTKVERTCPAGMALIYGAVVGALIIAGLWITLATDSSWGLLCLAAMAVLGHRAARIAGATDGAVPQWWSECLDDRRKA